MNPFHSSSALLRARRGVARTAPPAVAATCALVAIVASASLLTPGSIHAQTPDSTPSPAGDSAARANAPPSALAPHPADVAFMRGMIVHHQQALDMSELIPGRHADPQIALLGERIAASQKWEIRLMRNWLGARGVSPEMDAGMDMGPMAMEAAREAHEHAEAEHEHAEAEHGHAEAEHEHAEAEHEAAGHEHAAMHAAHHPMMAGMATPEQMADLAASSGSDFDRMFLTLMIRHHEGALTMVQDLQSTEGGGLDPELFQLLTHIDADQRAEIARMRTMLEAM